MYALLMLGASSALARAPRHEPAPHARAAIVGGSQIPITLAPWQVAVFSEVTGGELLCGGSIVSSTEIITAGHCVFDPTTETQVSGGSVLVIAGTASITTAEVEHGATVQTRPVSEVRVHPYYEYAQGAGAPDDVAVLTLASPLSFDAQVKPISLVATGMVLPEGTPATVTGFGEQSSGAEPDGALYSFPTGLTYSGECSEQADALFLCARTAVGSACHGDSGGGLTVGSGPELAGVVDIVEIVHGECSAGAYNGFVNLAAPEIRDFIEGGTNPPKAPRGGSDIKVRAVPVVGHPATCEAGTWSGAPTFTYAFIDTRTGQVLQASPSTTYQLTTSDAGRTISCEVRATNDGGTGYQRTTALRAVELPGQSSTGQPSGSSAPPHLGSAAPSQSLSLVGTKITVSHSGQAVITLKCLGRENCTGKLTLTARHTGRTVTLGVASVIVAGESTTIITIKLNRIGRSLLSRARGRLTAKFEIAVKHNGSQAHVVHLVEQRKRNGGRPGK